jgi:hypothetical protein
MLRMFVTGWPPYCGGPGMPQRARTSSQPSALKRTIGANWSGKIPGNRAGCPCGHGLRETNRGCLVGLWSNYRDCTSSPIMRPRANNHQQGTSAIHKARCQSWRDKMNCRAHIISWRRERGPRAGAEGWRTTGDERDTTLCRARRLSSVQQSTRRKRTDRIAPLIALKPD